MKKLMRLISVVTLAVFMMANTSVGVLGKGVVLNDKKDSIVSWYGDPATHGKGDKKYEKEFLQITEFDSDERGYFYVPMYEYYSDDDPTSAVLPDYVLIYSGIFERGPLNIYGTYGDYIVTRGGWEIPYDLGFCVYIPEKKAVMSLRDAYDTGVPGIENIFSEYGFGRLRGDINEDRKITVKDATLIQKCLAGIKELPEYDLILGYHEGSKMPIVESKYISDFNRDGKRDIKDATAIQKHIAGIPY